MWIAPGRVPCSYSSASRTSSTTVPGLADGLGRLGGRDLPDAGLGLLQKIAERRHGEKPHWSMPPGETLPSRSAFPLGRLTVGPLASVHGVRAVLRRRGCAAASRPRPVPARTARTGSWPAPGGRRRPASARVRRSWSSKDRSRPRTFWSHASDDRPGGPAPTWPGLLRAPVIILPLAHKQAYLDRYASRTRPASAGRRSRRGRSRSGWWTRRSRPCSSSSARSTPASGALFFGLPGGERALLPTLGVPSGYRADRRGGARAGRHAEDRPSPSLARGRRPADEVIHRGRW